jgi:hypothetical protein
MWTGEVIEKKFKIPGHGAKFWSGCYGSPGACLAALRQTCTDNLATQDQYHELHDTLRASLKLEPAHGEVKFTIETAPHYRTLKEWGGALDLAEFHKQYDHDSQVMYYYQDTSLVPISPTEPQDPATNPNAPKRWRKLCIPSRGGLVAGGGVGFDGDQPKVIMPRCIKALNAWLREFSTDRNNPNRVTMYFHTSAANNTVFAVGIGGETDILNKAASEFLGKTPVHGDVVLFSKNRLLIPKRRAQGQEPGTSPTKKQKKILP